MGGYIAASSQIISAIRAHASGSTIHNSLSPIIAAQVLRALHVITGQDGSTLGAQKLLSLKENANYFRKEMHRLGLHVLGNEDSPIVPILFYLPFKVRHRALHCLPSAPVCCSWRLTVCLHRLPRSPACAWKEA